MRIEVALGRIAELQTELDRVKGLAAYLSEDEIRADERHNVVEGCIAEASKWITTKWRQEGMADAIRAKYLLK